MKTVGTRRLASSALEDQGRLARTAMALRGGGFAPRGVYRFASHDEAERWFRQWRGSSKPVRGRAAGAAPTPAGAGGDG